MYHTAGGVSRPILDAHDDYTSPGTKVQRQLEIPKLTPRIPCTTALLTLTPSHHFSVVIHIDIKFVVVILST